MSDEADRIQLIGANRFRMRTITSEPLFGQCRSHSQFLINCPESANVLEVNNVAWFSLLIHMASIPWVNCVLEQTIYSLELQQISSPLWGFRKFSNHQNLTWWLTKCYRPLSFDHYLFRTICMDRAKLFSRLICIRCLAYEFPYLKRNKRSK